MGAGLQRGVADVVALRGRRDVVLHRPAGRTRDVEAQLCLTRFMADDCGDGGEDTTDRYINIGRRPSVTCQHHTREACLLTVTFTDNLDVVNSFTGDGVI